MTNVTNWHSVAAAVGDTTFVLDSCRGADRTVYGYGRTFYSELQLQAIP